MELFTDQHMSNISAEELFGIIPIDEEAPESISALILKKKEEIDLLETRKSNDYYENLRERENGADYVS